MTIRYDDTETDLGAGPDELALAELRAALDAEPDQCPCGTAMGWCPCGDPRCWQCDPPTPGSACAARMGP